MGPLAILVPVLARFIIVRASFQLYLEDGSLPSGVTNSTTCGKALQTTLACDPTLQQASNMYFDANHSSVICTSTCFKSLASYRASVSAACLGTTIEGEDIVYPSTIVADMLLFSYNTTCLKDASTGEWCGPQFSTWANETSADGGLGGLPTSQLCSSCFLQHAELALQSPIGYDPNAVDDFTVLQQTCGISYNLTTPGTAYINVTTTPPASTVCLSGKTYTVQPGDTCASISKSQNVGTKDLISLNGLDSSCTKIQGGQSLCLPATCQTYLVQPGDTCYSLLDGLSGVSFAQFYAWNPTINTYCTNLIAGTYICVSPPGGAYTYTMPSVTVAPTGTAITTTTPPPTSTAEGTVPNCGKWYIVQLGDDCNRVLLNQTITLSDFIAANPEINAGCTNLFLGYAYCVYQIPLPSYPSTYAPVPTNLAPGTTKYCFTYYTVQSGDTCQAIASKWTITVPRFKQWNPELNSDCSNLIAGEAYCVYAQLTNGSGGTTTSGTITPTPTTTSTASRASTISTATASVPPVPPNAAPGAVSPCYKWYTVVSGDYCYLIGQKQGCTVAQLVQWNPSLGSNCVAQLGVAYCVSA